MTKEHGIERGNSTVALSIHNYFLLLPFSVTTINHRPKASTGFHSTCVSNMCKGENQGNGRSKMGIDRPQI